MKHKMPGKLIASVLLTLFAATAGCSDNDEKQCTLIGCENGINLNFEDADGKPINTFKGTITIADKVIAIDCGSTANSHGPEYSCNQNQVFLRGTDATELHVDIQATNNTSVFFEYNDDVQVAYESLYPNGEDCDAACKQASKTLVMVAGGVID